MPLNVSPDLAAQVASEIGCEPAAVMAVAEVESNGTGYLADGRPAILFEAHIFSQRTGRRFDKSHPGISSAAWNRSLYRGGAREYDRLMEAYALDATAAMCSASWGAFQIMGFNHRAAGFATVEQFVQAMKGPIENHVRAFAAFINGQPQLRQALIDRNWREFARLYNGAGAVASYSAKIGDAYERLAGGQRFASIEGPPLPVADPNLQNAGASKSKTIWALGTAGGATALSVADQLSNASAAASSVTSIGYSVTSFLRMFGLPIALGVIVVGLCAWLGWRYYGKIKAGDTIVR